MPGQFEAFARRKAFFEKEVRAAIRDGVVQVLVLGAGYDTLGWRLEPDFPGVRFFELDHPATSAMKTRGLSSLEERPNLHLIAGDLGESSLDNLLQSAEAWNRSLPSVITAEGLLMYLSSDSVRGLFQQCAEVCPRGSRMAFSFVGTDEKGRPTAGRASWLFLPMLKLMGEPWLWGSEPGGLPEMLEPAGWHLAPGEEGQAEKCGVEYLMTAHHRSDV